MRKVTYSDLIAAWARGEIVEFQGTHIPGGGWYRLEADNTEVLPFFMRTDGNTVGSISFRLKPRTVKIGSREVEAPVLEPEIGQEMWYWDAGRWAPEQATGAEAKAANDFAKAGMFFSSPEACTAAHEAIAALLRGEA
ncbi:MAG: hypothetical protein RSE94_11640 [Pseudomonas sp.]